jgi:regulator of protease activity HflC (stomatin/prohibitin superfamily)
MKDLTLDQIGRTRWTAPLKSSVWLICGLFVIMAGCSSFQIVATGHVGVVTRFNKVTGEVMGEGLNFKMPWEKVHEMTVRQQQLHEQGNVPSSEMLVLGLQTTLFFHLQTDKATSVYDKLGPNYVQATVEPNFISAMRESTSKHKAEELFSGKQRDVIAEEAFVRMRTDLGPYGVEVEKVLLRDISPPETLKRAIEAKQQAEQEALAMTFRLQKERQEAERKRIEAQGIKDFQDIVRKGIDEQLLVWKGIEATESLAKSPNTKIVVVGNKQGLPLILDSR